MGPTRRQWRLVQRRGERRIGLVAYEFDADGFTCQTVFPAGVTDWPLDPVIGRIYPSPQSTVA